MTILVENRAGYRVITLNRPERLNALTAKMARPRNKALHRRRFSSCVMYA